jgi:hypothetical protein
LLESSIAAASLFYQNIGDSSKALSFQVLNVAMTSLGDGERLAGHRAVGYNNLQVQFIDLYLFYWLYTASTTMPQFHANAVAGTKCNHQFCWECFASHKQILKEDNSVHKPTCMFHPSNQRDTDAQGVVAAT